LAIAVFLILFAKIVWNIVGIAIYLNLEFSKCSAFILLYYNTEFMVYFIYFICLVTKFIFKDSEKQNKTSQEEVTPSAIWENGINLLREIQENAQKGVL
jgi:hypothetical protein